MKELEELRKNLSEEDKALLAEWYKEQMLLMEENPLDHGFPPHKGQLLVHEEPHDLRLLISANRWGKMSPVDTPVLTPTGWIEIGSLRPTDRVIAGDGSQTTVKAVYPQGTMRQYRAVFSDGSSVLVGGPHLWRAKDPEARFRKHSGRYGEWGVYTTDEIIERVGKNPPPPRRFSIPVVGPVEFDSQPVPLNPYLVGALLGDGSIARTTAQITNVDPEVIHEVLMALPPGVGPRSLGTGKDFSLMPCSAIRKDLEALGLYGRRSWEKHVPREYLINSPEVRLAVLQGLMDTDGTADKQGRASFTSTSRQLAEDVMFLARSFGASPRWSERQTHYTHNGEKKAGRPSYRVRFRSPEGLRVFRIARKQARLYAETTLERVLVRIEDGPKAEAVCIEVEHPEHTYVTKDFIVTHNSMCGMREALWLATMTHPYQENRPHNMIWVGFPDFPFYRRVTRKAFFEWCPRGRLIQFHETERWAHVRRDDGGICEIHFLSYDSGREKWQGAAVDFCWLDEECPEDIFREAMARLIDKRGKMLKTLTPLGGLGWVYDRLYMPAVNGDRSIRLITGRLANYDPEEPFGVGEPEVPHMAKDQIVRFARSIPDPDERAIRVFGEFRSRSGIVYKQFIHDVHVIPAFDIPRHWEVWAGVDPGWHGFAVCFFAMAPDGRVYIVDEYFSQQESFRVRAERILAKARNLGFEKEDEYLALYVDTEDPQMVTELNIWAQEQNAPLSFASLDQGLKARKAGVTRVQELLAVNPDRHKGSHVSRPPREEGEPILHFFDNLKSHWWDGEEQYEQSRVVWELTRYLWKNPPKGKEHAPIDNPDDNTAGGAHMMAAMRYGVMARTSSPEDLAFDRFSHLAPHERRIWEHLEALENRHEKWIVQ